MTYSDIKKRLDKNMERFNGESSDIRIQKDPFDGWRIAVISPFFVELSNIERKKIALQGLESLKIQWLDLLSPDEAEWAGNLPIDSPIDDLPLWAEAMARSSIQNKDAITFASDLDEDVELPIIVTFYSLRGGVGRTTALAYTAQILASLGRTVLCVDMDMEAPGLTAILGKDSEVEPGQGLLSILIALDQQEKPDIMRHIIRVSEKNELYCIPAGKPDANYAKLLNLVDPQTWYREEKNPLRELRHLLSKELSFKADVILLDARTGISPLSGPMLFDLADLDIITFFPHPQAYSGTQALVKALLAAKNSRVINDTRLTPEPRFLVSPIPASKAPEIITRYRHRAIEWISDWLSGLDEKRQETEAITESEITHFIPYRETIATSDQILFEKEIWKDYEPIAEWIERFLPAKSERTVRLNLADSKPTILLELEFSVGTAETQQNFLENFVETELVNKAISPEIPLVLGRKGSGKTAIFRRIMDDPNRPSIVVLSPGPLKRGRDWLLGPDGFKAIENIINEKNTGWREFWMVYTCLACQEELKKSKPGFDGELPEKIGEIKRPIGLSTELQTVECIEKLISIEKIGLYAGDWLKHLDRLASENTFMLIDGLDTGFGSSIDERDRRRVATEGLFSFMTSSGENMHNLRFKVLLREDIWRKLRFENKSHLYGRSVRLEWADKEDYYKIVIKQALHSQTFKTIIRSTERWGELLMEKIEKNAWHNLPVLDIWNYLVGERMAGERTAYTRNWVWVRLADGNDDRGPRTLLQLFREATDWEKKEHRKNAYEKSVLRPRALSSSLPKVSEEALGALLEEFSELRDLVNHLRELDRTPVNASDLKDFESYISLAREVGLLAIYEGTVDHVQRYKVPEIYRLAIGLSRKGQA